MAAENMHPGGAVWAVLGPVVTSLDLASEADFLARGGAYCLGAGRAIDMGDVNGDGLADLFAGAPYGGEDHPTGMGFLVYGPLTGEMELDGSDAILETDATTCELAGHGVALGDQDGDGFEDLALGVYRDDMGATDGGAVYIWNGPVSGEHLVPDADASLYSPSPGAWAGYRTSAGGDLDGDGIGDHQVSAIYDSSGAPNGGAIYLAHGPITGATSLEDAEVMLLGESYLSMAGWAVSTGDANGDGLDDVAIGAYYGGGGLAYLVYSPKSGTLSLGDSDVVFEGVSGRVGQAVSIGNVDSDGIADVAVGAPSEDGNGVVHLHYSPLSGIVDLAASDATFTGDAGSYTGTDLLIRDLDGNGLGDIAIGAYQDGAIYVFLNPL